MRRLIVISSIIAISATSFAAELQETEEKKTFYNIGQIMARQLSIFNLTPAELDLVKQGLTDGVSGKETKDDLEAESRKIQALAISRRNAQGEKLAVKAKEVVSKAAAEKGAIKKPSGLIYLSLKEGSGASPAATDTVKVNYRGTLVDGKEFDSSYKRGTPAEFPLDKVIKCWTEGVQMMKPGGKAKLVCPPDIAYGKEGPGIIPPNATLLFEVELLETKKTADKKPE
jgi:FKBP-type peptidyl-prolyl cis-trans isomerase FkpA